MKTLTVVKQGWKCFKYALSSSGNVSKERMNDDDADDGQLELC